MRGNNTDKVASVVVVYFVDFPGASIHILHELDISIAG
jgi:hypothetical protein